MSLYTFINLFGRKADPPQIVAGADFYVFLWGVHEVKGCLDGVRHVHHWQVGVFFQEAFKMLSCNRFMIDVHGVVCRSTSWEGFIPNKTGVSQTPDVNMVFLEIVITPSFPRLFGNAIHCIRIHDAVLRGLMAGTIWAKNGNGRRPIYLIHF